MCEKIRLDMFLTEKGFAPSREKAKAMISAGNIYVKGKQCTKPGQLILCDETELEIRGEVLKYVSRGGLKLEKAILEFGIDLKEKSAMDIGASTGGFTDCMLQNGAKKIYAVDVGKDQLAEKMKNNPKVVNMENTNIRYISSKIMEKVDFISVDVSFISLTLVLPVAFNMLSDSGEAVALIKPQFEAGRRNVGKKGVVRDKKIHCEVIRKIRDFAAGLGFCPSGLSFSPIKGAEGNIEYLIYLKKESMKEVISETDIEYIVNESHKI